jgi:RNA polymerase sigma factor (TIGR02999 family)
MDNVASAEPSGKLQDEVSAVLRKMEEGDPEARSSLVTILYPELRRIAERRMSCERSDHTLQPTALVNEFFLRLARQERYNWRNRAHFLAAASCAMRNMLIDYARHKGSLQQGGKRVRVQLDDLMPAPDVDLAELATIGDLLGTLAGEEPRMAQVVDLRCFGGLTFQEIGDVLDVDERTAMRDWQVARAWLRGQLRRRGDAG